MPYSTGAAGSTSALLAALDTFLVANGWTRNNFVDNGGTNDEYYWNDGGSAFFSATQIADSLKFYANTGYNGGSAVNAQPGTLDNANWDAVINSVTTGTSNREGQVSNVQGPYSSHHFFLDQRGTADYLICVIEQSPALTRWFGFGTIDRAGDPEINHGQFLMTDGFVVITGTESLYNQQGGPFSNYSAGGRSPTFMVRLDLDGVAADWYGRQNAPTGNTNEDYLLSSSGWGTTEGFGSDMFGDRADIFATYSGFFPLRVCNFLAIRDLNDITPEGYSMVGKIPAMYYLNLERFTPGQVVTIDGDDYILFSQGRKSETNAPAGGNTGVAMLRDL